MYPRDAEIRDALKFVQRENLNRLADQYNWTEAQVERRAADEILAFFKLDVPAHKAADLHTLITERTLKEFTPEEAVGLREESNRRLRQRYSDSEMLRVKSKISDYEKSNPELGEMLSNDGLRNSPEIVLAVASAIRQGEGRE